MAAGSGAAAPDTSRAITLAVEAGSASASQSSIGIETNAGPLGGVAARWMARASACGTSAARAGSKLDLTSGCGMRVASRLRSEEHTSELQSQSNLVCRLLLEKKKIQSPLK